MRCPITWCEYMKGCPHEFYRECPIYRNMVVMIVEAIIALCRAQKGDSDEDQG